MTNGSSFPEVRRIIADSDMDGMCAAVVLKKAYPHAEVHFAHAALIRSGIIDHLIDDYNEYKKDSIEQRQTELIEKGEAVFPCRLKISKMGI